MISLTGFSVPTPPIPGQAPAAPAQPQAAPAPQAPPQQPVAASTPPPPVTEYWAVNGSSFHTLSQAGQAMQAGQTIPPAMNGFVKAQKLVWADGAAQQAIHSTNSKRYLKNALVTGVLSATVGAMLGPLAMVGMAVAAWNGYKAYQEHQAAQQPASPGYVVAEEGRIKAAPTLQPLPYTYEAIDADHFGNVVPEHPFFYKQAVPLSQL